MITFPPKCSHKMQPLDITVYGPFKRFYFSFCTLEDNIAKMFGKACGNAFTIKNITAGFKTISIYLFNPHMFSKDEFLISLQR